MRNLQRLIAVLCCAVLALLTGCSSDLPGPERERSKKPKPTQTQAPVTGTLADIQVTGTWSTRPDVEFPMPLLVEEPETTILVAGAGPRLKEGGKALLAIYAQSGSDGEVLTDHFTDGPKAFRMLRSDLGDDLYETMVGVRTGSRVLHVVHDSVPLVMVIDVLPLFASGEPVEDVAAEAPDGAPMPTVNSKKDGTPVVNVPKKKKPPATLTTSVLIRGNGAQVLANETAVLQYQAVRWSKNKVVGSTWDPDELPVTVKVGADTLIEGLDAALTDLTVGSRILVVVPPVLAFGPAGGKWQNETMVYVVDVLAASAPSTGDETVDESDEADDDSPEARDKAADESDKRE